jgi:hypothetical protein
MQAKLWVETLILLLFFYIYAWSFVLKASAGFCIFRLTYLTFHGSEDLQSEKLTDSDEA